MAYRIFQDGEILRLEFDGNLTTSELTEIGRAIRQFEPDGKLVPHRITNLGNTSGLSSSFDDIFAFAQERRKLKFANSFKSAIVAPLPVHVGIARMFATLNDHPQISIRIFPDMGSARAWIAEP